ncbi:MAG: sulfite exporter TauE/SafE family protein [Christensenella sp.]|nr:sulfite exporter TauE/SafE family protein [Christensenella sp.]
MDQTAIFHVLGMTCAHCEARVSKAARGVPGVRRANASFSKKTLEVAYDPSVLDEPALTEAITSAVEAEGYRVAGRQKESHPVSKVIPVVLSLIGLYLLLRYTVGFDFFGFIPKIDSTISLSALFLTGLLTSVHCIAMCGGINLFQSVSANGTTRNKLRNPLLYNLGRVISYTVIGGIVGGIGSVLFLSEAVKAVLLALAAIGMLLMGLSMLGWLPWWLTPRMPKFLALRIGKSSAGKGPLVVGLLNGLMPCGPLQAMQLYALATGSVLTGALSMFLFSLGTVPLMLGAGALFSVLKGKFAYVIQRVSAVLVVFFAVVMAANALSLVGLRPSPVLETPPATTATIQKEGDSLLQQALDKGYLPATVEGGVQRVKATLNPSVYPFIIVQKGIPVELTITADQNSITGCNQTVVFPSYDVKKALTPGDNVIKFTPDETGLVSYTCWMGMLDGRILVVDDLGGTSGGTASAKASPAAQSPAPQIDAPNLEGTRQPGGCCG